MRTLVTISCCLALALTAFGQGQKKFTDLADLQAHFDQQADAAMVKVNKDRLAALEAWMKDAANKESADLPKAKMEASRLKVEIVTKGDGNGAAIKEAHSAFLQSLDNEGIQAGFNMTNMVTDRLMVLEDFEAAKAAWNALGEKFGDHPNAGGQIKQIVAKETGDLDLIGKEPKAFNVKDLKDQELSLEKYKGKVVLLDFWATWCGPCKAELPNVIATYKKLHPKGFEIVGVSLDKEDKTVLEKFLADHPDMSWPQFYDGKWWKNEVAQLYGVQSIPATYLIDQEGKVYRVGLRGKELEKAIEKLLAKGGKKS